MLTVELAVREFVVIKLAPFVPLTALEIAVEQVLLLYKRIVAASLTVTVTCGVGLLPGDVGLIDVNVSVGLVVSTTISF
jgi:hypothetical protein